MFYYTLIFYDVNDALPPQGDDSMKIVITETQKGKIDYNRAYWDGRWWHGSGSMSNVKYWASMNALDVVLRNKETENDKRND